MWNGLRLSRPVNPEFAASISDLLHSIQRLLIAFSMSLCLLWYVFSHFTPSTTAIYTSLFALVVVGATGMVALWLPRRRAPISTLIWLLGLLGGVTLSVNSVQQPALVFFYAVIPLLATVLLHWSAGVFATVLIAVLLNGLSANSWMSMPAAGPLGPITLLVSAMLVVVGWALTRSLLTVTQWSLWSLQKAQRETEEARNQKVELIQVQQDLVQANQELARLSDVLKSANHVAEDARRLKEEFVANVSHELRTPLNMIIGFSEMIVQAPQTYGNRLPPALLADITAIQRNSQHLAKLVDDVLDLSQMEVGRMTLSKEWVAPCEIIDEAALAVRALYDSKQLYLTTECPDNLPHLFCDGTRIRQVILNLLSNAGRFTERGGVCVKAQQQDDRLVISVADTGPGIAPEDQKRIFEPFQQLDSSIRRKHGGSGLGLTISKRFVEMHNGKLWLESTPGLGTTFHVGLPLESPQPQVVMDGNDARRWFSPHQQYIPRTRRTSAPLPTPEPRYVILEAGDSLAQIIGRHVNGIAITSVRTIDDAIHELERSPAHALIVNTATMAEDAIPRQKLVALPYGIPAVKVWVPGKDYAARQLGVVRYMVRPVTHQALLSAIEEVSAAVQTVLLVDDQAEVLQLFARMLSSAGRRYRILQAMDGQRALSLLRERKPDLVLLDMVMPGMDGLQLLEQKGGDPSIRDIPVIVVSSKDPNADPVASDTLTVVHGGGMLMGDLIACIQAISQVLAPGARSADPAQPETPVA